MAARKLTVSVSQEVMDQVDLAAAEQRLTRSAYVVFVLRKLAGAKTDDEISRRINEIICLSH